MEYKDWNDIKLRWSDWIALYLIWPFNILSILIILLKYFSWQGVGMVVFFCVWYLMNK